jgi:hypothetical protein
MEPFARTIDAAKKYVVSRTMDRVDWNAELVRGDLGKAVQQLKRESGKGLLVGGVKLPLALAELGLIDEYEFLVQPELRKSRPLHVPAIEARRAKVPSWTALVRAQAHKSERRLRLATIVATVCWYLKRFLAHETLHAGITRARLPQETTTELQHTPRPAKRRPTLTWQELSAAGFSATIARRLRR